MDFFELEQLEDKKLMEKLHEKFYPVKDIVEEFEKTHMNYLQPSHQKMLGAEAMKLNALLYGFASIIAKVEYHRNQYKSMKEARWNEIYSELRDEAEQEYEQKLKAYREKKIPRPDKRTDGELKAKTVVKLKQEADYDAYINGLYSWMKRLDLMYERAVEQVNLMKKVYDKSVREEKRQL